MPMHPLTADGGEVTVLRSLAAYSYGAWDVSWPDSVPEEQQPDPGEGRQFGYFADFNRTPGRMGRRFVRNDVSITAAEYINGELVPHSGVSDVEDVLDSAENRTSGEAYLEREIPDGGLGGMIPYLDFGVDDIVPVSFWGKLMFLPVTEIRLVSSVGDAKNYVVHVGGSLLADIEARNKDYNEMARLIAQERRERTKSVKSVERSASRAQSTADRVRTDFDELAKRVERDAQALAIEIDGLVTNADFEEYDGELQKRLWGEQGEFNRITADSLSKQEQINAQQKLIDAQQDEIADALKKQVALSTALSAANAKAIEVQKEAERKRPRPVFATYSSYNPRYVDPEGYLRIEPYSTGDRGFRLTCLGDWTGTMVVRATAIGPLSANSIDSVRCRVTSSSRIFNGTPEALQMSYNTLDVTIYPD